MIKIKHFMDAPEPDDGQRIWVESTPLTRDLCQWCGVDRVFCHLGPPISLWRWFEAHPDGYDYFRGKYHRRLAEGPYRAALQAMACASAVKNYTLLHQADDPAHNSATALYEFLSELTAYCSEA